MPQAPKRGLVQMQGRGELSWCLGKDFGHICGEVQCPTSTYDVHECLRVVGHFSILDDILQPLGQAQGHQQQPHLTCPQHLGITGLDEQGCGCSRGTRNTAAPAAWQHSQSLMLPQGAGVYNPLCSLESTPSLFC